MTHSHDRTFLRSIGFEDPDRNAPEHDMACRYLAEPAQLKRLTDLIMPSRVTEEDGFTSSYVWQWPGKDALLAKLDALRIAINGPWGANFSISARDIVGHNLDLRIEADGRIDLAPANDRGATFFAPGTNPSPHLLALWHEKREQISSVLREYIAAKPMLEQSGRTFPYHSERVGVSWAASSPLFEEPISKGEGKYLTTVGFADLLFKATAIVRRRSVGQAMNPDGTRMVNETIHEGPSYPVLVEVKAQRVATSTILKQVKLYAQHIPRARYWNENGFSGDLPLVVATLYQMPASEAALLKSQGITPIRLGAPFEAWMAEQQKMMATPAKDEEF